MAFSTVLIEFAEVPTLDQQINIFEVFFGINIIEVFKDFRSSAGECEIPYFFAEDYPVPERYFGYISQNYSDAVSLDYNVAGQFTIDFSNGDENSGLGSVLITANSIVLLVYKKIEQKARVTPLNLAYRARGGQNRDFPL